MDAQPAYYVVKKEDKSKSPRELGPFRAAELETQRVLQGVDYEYLQSLHGVQKVTARSGCKGLFSEDGEVMKLHIEGSLTTPKPGIKRV